MGDGHQALTIEWDESMPIFFLPAPEIKKGGEESLTLPHLSAHTMTLKSRQPNSLPHKGALYTYRRPDR
jgi:hypothetical protein